MSICLLSCLLCNGELIIRGNLPNFISTCLGRMKVWNSLDWVTCYPLHFTLAYIVYQESRNRQFVYIHVHYGVHGEMYIGIVSRLIDLSLCCIICSQIEKIRVLIAKPELLISCHPNKRRSAFFFSRTTATAPRRLRIAQKSAQFRTVRKEWLSALMQKSQVGGTLYNPCGVDCIYIYYRKFNAEFNKLIKTVGHLACCYPKMMLNTPTFANSFNFIWIFSYSHL